MCIRVRRNTAILKNHISLKTLEELPAIFIDDFENIDFDYILKENDKLSKINFSWRILIYIFIIN